MPLGYLVTPKKGQTENPRRVIDGEREARRRVQVAPADLLAVPGDAVHVHERSRTSAARRSGARPATRCSSSTTGCARTGRPIRCEAAQVNSRKVLLDRFRKCAARRKRAAERDRGRLHRDRRRCTATVSELNSAIAKVDRASRSSSTRRSGTRSTAGSSPRPRRARSGASTGCRRSRSPRARTMLGAAAPVPARGRLARQARGRQLRDERDRDRAPRRSADPAPVRRPERSAVDCARRRGGRTSTTTTTTPATRRRRSRRRRRRRRG